MRPHLTGSWVPKGGEAYGRRQAFQFPELKGEIYVMLETCEKLQLIFPLSRSFFFFFYLLALDAFYLPAA